MTVDPPLSIKLIVDHFGGLKDLRVDRTKFHPFINIIVISVCASIAGAEGWDAMAEFGKIRRGWLSQFLDMPRGVPSADTFRRVLSSLLPVELEACIRSWVNALRVNLKGEIVAIDGKSLRGAFDKAGSTTPLHLVHVWATEQRLLLGQRAVAGAPGEISGAKELLRLLDVEGAIVTLDANGCTPAIAEAIQDGKADYVLALKGNRGPIHAEVKALFESLEDRGFRGAKTEQTNESGHGRAEERTVHVVEPKTWPANYKERWKGLRCAVMVERKRLIQGKQTVERHYYLSSLPPEPDLHAKAIRAHWGIENNLHWVLDVTFGEDRQRIRNKRGAENFALINRLALMLLQRDKSKSVKMQRKLAGWDGPYLLGVLTRGFSIA
jgi:predicted transposase YbfD/YdcC